ncbi:MAG: GNAT family N-acetyltransferase [Ruminococcaceae bacterium]|nr:GNAT family N-acetyltransferase [Oscillospiraceae bacterium]
MPSLRMKWSGTPFEIPEVPEGYKFHVHVRGNDPIFTDEEAMGKEWLKMIVTGIEVEESFIDEYFNDPMIPDDGFFMVLDKDNKIVANAGIQFGKTTPDSATLHMVVADPEHRGKKLGKIVTAAVLDYAQKHNMFEVYLSTGDERKAAVIMYLKLGFRPCLYTAGMEERWCALFDEFNYQDRRVLDANENEIVI